MNNLSLSNVTVGKELVSFVQKNGKYGCYAVGMVLLYDLCVKAIDKGYRGTVSVKEDGVSFSFNPPVTAS